MIWKITNATFLRTFISSNVYMLRKMKRLIIFALVLVGMNAYAQNSKGGEEPDIDDNHLLIDYEDDGAPPVNGYRSQIEFHIASPHIFMNQALNRTFNGIAGVQLGYNVQITKNFKAGVYGRFSAYKYYAGRFQDIDPLWYNAGAGINLSYHVAMGERFFYLPSVMIGASFNTYQNLVLPPKGVDDRPATHLDYWSFQAQTNQGFYYWVKQNRTIAVGLVIGFAYDSHNYRYSETKITDGGNVFAYSEQGPTLTGNIGFGVITNFGKVKARK